MAPSLVCSNVEVVGVFRSSLVRVGRFYGRRTSKIAFGKIVWLSFKWLLVMDSARTWNLSIVLRWGPFLWRCRTCIISFIGPKEWPYSLRCFQSCRIGYCFGRRFCVLCISWRIVYQAVRRKLCCNRGRRICMLLIVSACQGVGFCR